MAVIRGTARCALLEAAQDHEDPALAGRQRLADRQRGTRPLASARGPLGPPIVAEVLDKKDALARQVPALHNHKG
jgi:hypothetical protein